MIYDPNGHKFPCAECGGDAFIGMSGLKNLKTGAVVIRDDERLCLKCGNQRIAESESKNGA